MSADADEVSEPSSWFSSPPTESPPPKQCTGLKECTRLAFMHVSAAVFAGLAWSRAVMIAWSAAAWRALLWLATRPKVLMSSIGRVIMLGPRVWIRGAVTLTRTYWSTVVRLLIAFTAGVSATRAHAHIKALLSPPSRHFFAQIYAATSSFVRWAIGLEPKEAEISYDDSADDNDDDGDDPKPWFAILNPLRLLRGLGPLALVFTGILLDRTEIVDTAINKMKKLELPGRSSLEEPPQASTMMPSYTPRLSYMPPHAPRGFAVKRASMQMRRAVKPQGATWYQVL